MALKLPNFLRRLFAEGAFNNAFVPIFSEYRINGDHRVIQEVVQTVFTMLTTVLFWVVVGAELFMPAVVWIAAPGFASNAVKFNLTVELTRVTFPYILFISLVGMAGGILNTYRRFAVPAATSILLNLTLIFGALVLSPWFAEPAMGLAVGVFIGGVLQLAVQWPALGKIDLSFRWRWDPHHPAIGHIVRLMGPAILGVSVSQVNFLVDLFIASWLPEGSISYLYYADRLVEFPLGLIGVAMGTAILPGLSEKVQVGDIEGLKHDLDFALRLIAVVNIPATVGLILLREPILALLFGGGAFDDHAMAMTSQALLAFSLGLLAFSSIKVVAPAFYAFKDTKTPVRAAIIAMSCNILLNLALMVPLRHAGLALATTIAAFVNVSYLLYQLKKRIDYSLSREAKETVWRTCLASTVMAGFLAGWNWLFWQPHLGNLRQLLLLVPEMILAIFLFVAVGWILHLTEIHRLARMLFPSISSVKRIPDSPDAP